MVPYLADRYQRALEPADAPLARRALVEVVLRASELALRLPSSRHLVHDCTRRYERALILRTRKTEALVVVPGKLEGVRHRTAVRVATPIRPVGLAPLGVDVRDHELALVLLAACFAVDVVHEALHLHANHDVARVPAHVSIGIGPPHIGGPTADRNHRQGDDCDHDALVRRPKPGQRGAERSAVHFWTPFQSIYYYSISRA